MSKWQNEDLVSRLVELKENGYSEKQIAIILSEEFPEHEYTKDSVGNFYRRLRTNINEEGDEEVLEENIKLSRKLQGEKDKSRIERKSWRNVVRFENFFEEYTNELIKVIKKYTFNISNTQLPKHKEVISGKMGIIQISDIHFNEIISLPENMYDFDVASKRLKKYADKARLYLKANGITSVLIASTGDLINSDRHIDEMLSMATNRAKAVFIGAKLMEYFILDLAQDFNISFAGVTGNESRIQKDLGLLDITASDNYDTTLYNLLQLMFRDNSNIQFFLDDPNEIVCNINGINVLLTHGYNYPLNGGLDKEVAETTNRFAQKGIIIKYIIFGHYHEARIGEEYARSSSLAGANSYSKYGLNLSSKASQNIHIIDQNGDIDAIKVCLQDVSDVDGYNINKEKSLYMLSEGKKQEVQIFAIR